MGLYLRQQETRSDLQDKLAAELQERAKRKPQPFDQPDGVTDSAYLKNTKQTTTLAWAWALIAIAVIALVIWLIISTLS
jgi:hypothetical protein